MINGTPKKRQNVPVLILAGGLGTRISEESQLKPKPMIEVGDLPILVHVMRSYYAHGFDDFVICAGYKAWEIKSYFLNYAFRLNHLGIDHRTSPEPPRAIGTNVEQERWRVRVFDTGVDCMTGGRVARALDLMVRDGDRFDEFALTYGDGLSDVNLAAELAFHHAQGRVGTVLGVIPSARFGELDVDPARSSRVSGFLEKPASRQAWVSGGFFFFKGEFRKLLSDSADCVLEREPLSKLAASGELVMQEHRGFWHPMDTLRDKNYLQSLWESGKRPVALIFSLFGQMKSLRAFGLYAMTFVWLVAALALYTLVHQGRYLIRPGQVAIGLLGLALGVASVGLYRERRALLARGRTLALAWLWTVVGVYLAVGGLLYFSQDRLLFVSVPGRFGECSALGGDEEGSPREFESVDTGGGFERVRAYVRKRPDAGAWMILFHGNAESACSAIFYARQFMDLPLDFAVVEYPGYLGDPGPASQAAFQKNAEAVYAYAETQAALPVVSYGRSLGTGVATYLASVRPATALILISPYTSIADVGAYQYPYLPVRWLVRNPFPASEWAANVHAPVLIIHGTADRVVPIALGREEAARFFPPARMIEYPGGTHGTVVRADSPSWGEIRAFLRGILT